MIRSLIGFAFIAVAQFRPDPWPAIGTAVGLGTIPYLINRETLQRKRLAANDTRQQETERPSQP